MSSEGNYRGDERLNYQEAADFLGVSVSTLQHWVCQRRVEHLKVGRRVFFRRSAPISFLDSCVQAAIKAQEDCYA